MTTTLNGTTLADPDTPMKVSDVTPEAQKRTASNKLITQTASSKKLSWFPRWTKITEAQRNTIYTEYSTGGSMLWSPPNTVGTYTVHAKSQSWDEEVSDEAPAVGNRYSVGIVLEQE